MKQGSSTKKHLKPECFDASRRRFLRDSALLGGAGLSLGIVLPACSEEPGKPVDSAGKGQFSPSIWLTVNSDNSVMLTIAEAEMGQGVLTALPMLIAEEMDLDWQQITVRQAPVEAEFGYQLTGGSRSIRKSWQPLREAGATARQALLEAAAEKWQAPRVECLTRNGSVVWPQGQQELNYGELAVLAAGRPLPKSVQLKLPQNYLILGHPQVRTDLSAKTSGQARFGIDTGLPGMRVAVIARPPRLGEAVASFDAAKALAMPGVVDVIDLTTGIAVIAEGFWQAMRARDAINVRWHKADSQVDSVQIEQQMVGRLDGDAQLAWQRGDVAPFDGDDASTVQAVYRLPLQAHATMEPMNCSVWFHDGICEVWAPTQAPTRSREVAADIAASTVERYWQKIELRLTGESSDPVLLHTTLMGGGFGRRAEVDFVRDAVAIARRVAYPIKLIYSRGDDFASDYFRPPSVQRLRARLDQQGYPVQWHHRLVSNTDSSSGAKRLAYSVPNVLVDVGVVPTPHLRHGYWRSVAHSYTAFAVESFIDELAHVSDVDPLAYRLQMLVDAPRDRVVLEAVAKMAGWHQKQEGRYLGIAGHRAFGSYTAQVVELVRQPQGHLNLVSVYCAFDCGQVIDPDIVEAQLQGSIIYALTAALKSQVTVSHGVVEQSHFGDFPLLTFDETPEIKISLMASTESPGGVGEPGVPPLLPALANALYMATGERYRSFPVDGLELASGRAGRKDEYRG